MKKEWWEIQLVKGGSSVVIPYKKMGKIEFRRILFEIIHIRNFEFLMAFDEEKKNIYISKEALLHKLK